MFASLALGSGGSRGGLLVGALAALHRVRGNLTFPGGIYGCSVGSIVATAVAFGLSPDAMRAMFEEDFQLSAVLPALRLANVQELSRRKGMFPMDALESTVCSAFAKHGVDLRDKVVADAPQKLFIQATNLTMGRTTWFTGRVPLVKAILASCCIPLLFQPQVLYGQVYVDGGILEPFIHRAVPADCLVLHIERPLTALPPHKLEDMPLGDLVARLFALTRTTALPGNVVALRNNTIHVLQELTPADKETLFRDGSDCVDRFFAQHLAQERN